VQARAYFVFPFEIFIGTNSYMHEQLMPWRTLFAGCAACGDEEERDQDTAPEPRATVLDTPAYLLSGE
jgi:hypothetical protein